MSELKPRIRELLSKYANNEVSKKDLVELRDLLKDQKKTDAIKKTLDFHWKILLKKDFNDHKILSNELYQKVLDNIESREQTQIIERKNWPMWAKVAAVFIGLMVLTWYGHFKLHSTEVLMIPDENITLELEDGAIEVIENGLSTTVLDDEGNIIGKQHGNQLVYNKIQHSKELTYNTLTVPYGKRFELILSDGTLVHLNSGTSLKYPVEFIPSEGKRQVFLKGEAYFKVIHDESLPFVINSDGINVQVLGTEFNVSSYSDNPTSHVVLVQGSVELFKNSGVSEKSSLILEQGYKGQLAREPKAQFLVEKVDIIQYISWIEGNLLFRKSSLENMLKTFERHYNVSIVNHNEALNEILFNATFKNEPIEKVLGYLNEILGMDYQIKNNTVIIN